MKMKTKGLRAAFAFLLSALLLFQCLSAAAEAPAAGETAEASEFDVSGSKTTDPTELACPNRTTTVTLSLPSAEYQNKIDIVFAMDSSTSAESGTVFTDSAKALFASILENNPNVELKIGVIRFRGRAHDAVAYLSEDAYKGLTVYNNTTKQYIEGALEMTEAQVKAAFGSGSNTHGGIDIAHEWLKADTEVADDHKYMILLTDGKTYIWNDENHEPTTIYAQWYRSNSWAMQNSGKPALNQIVGYNKYDYPVDVVDPSGHSSVFVFIPTTLNSAGKPDYTISEAYEMLYNSTSEELTGVSPWDEACRYADGGGVPDGTVEKHNVTNGADLFGSNAATYGKRGDYIYWYEFTPNANWEGVKYQEGNPFEVIANADGTYTFDTEAINPNYYLYHVDPLQKGMYVAGHEWTEVNEKYNCAAVTYSGGSNDGGLQLRTPFIVWLHENSKFSADTSTAQQIQDMFTGIDNSIRYMVSQGTVTDVIGEDFTLENADAAEGFEMTLGGETVACTFADGKWNFGTAVEDVYPYVVEYDASSKTITWTINVPIENTNPITLSYDVILREDAETGFYDTNESAVLAYVTTDGEQGLYDAFAVPQVSYIKCAEIEVEKVWNDFDDYDEIRPSEITLVLTDGENEWSLVVTADDDWKGVFSHDTITPAGHLPDSKLSDDGTEFIPIEYTLVEEVEVDGYTVEIEGSAEDGYVITNTHVPEVEISVKKVWDDADDQDGVRPDSVTVHLFVGEDEVDSAEVTADDEWEYWFSAPKFDANGNEIEYTVTEDGVDAYDEPEIEDDEEADEGTIGFVIVNTHEPEKIDLEGSKIWDDDENAEGKRPSSVTVRLYADGTEIAQFEMNADNEWIWRYPEAPKYAAGKEIEYTITEDEVEGYTCKIEGFVVTNSIVPPTGEHADLLISIIALTAAVAAMAVMVYVGIRRRKESAEG